MHIAAAGRGKRIPALILALVLLLSGLPLDAAAAENGTAVTNTYVNLRSGKGTDSAVLDVLPSGTKVTVTDTSDPDWYGVRLSDGTTGYIYAEYLGFSVDLAEASAETLAAAAESIPAVTTATVNLRKGKGTNTASLGLVSEGTKLTVTDRSDKSWFGVRLSDGKTGYISSEYLKLTTKTDRAAVTTETVNLRKGKGTNTASLGLVAAGTKLTVTDTSDPEWYAVRLSNGTTGYVFSEYLQFTDDTSATPKPTATAKPTPAPSGKLDTPALSSVKTSGTKITVSWKKVSGASKYRVFYKKNFAGGWKQIVDTSDTSLTWDGGKTGSTYTFTVRCVSASGKYVSDYDTAGLSITLGSLETPSGVTAKLSDGSVKITWNKVTGAAQYRVFYKTNQTGGWKRLGTAKNTSFTWDGGKSGTLYAFTVRCLSADGKTYVSAYDKNGASVQWGGLAAPSGIAAKSSDGKIQITWKAVSGAAQYRVFYKTNFAGGWKKIADTKATSFIWDGGKAGNTYAFTVRCVSKDGKSYTSAYDMNGAAVTLGTLATPSGLAVTQETGGFRVSWSPVTGAEKYRLFYMKNGSWKRLQDTADTGVLLTNGTVGKTYTYTVRCISANGKQYTSKYDKTGVSAVFYKVKAPGKPAVTATSAGLTITWQAVEGAENYRVYYKTTGGWTKIATTAKTSVVWTNAEPGTVYRFTVRCLTADGKKFASGYNSQGTVFTAPKKGTGEYVRTTAGVYLREGPSEDSKSIRLLKSGTILDVIDRDTESWTRVQDADGTIGYVFSEYLEAYDPDSGSATASTSSAKFAKYQTFYLTGTTSGRVTWVSSDPNVVSVEHGVDNQIFLYGVEKGTAKVTAQALSGKALATVSVTVTDPEPIRFAYSTPNVISAGTSFKLSAVTDAEKSAVRFEIQGGGTYETKEYATESKNENNVRIFSAAASIQKPGAYTVRAYSAVNGAYGKSYKEFKILVVSTMDFTTTSADERRASTEMLNIIADFEGYVPVVEPDTLAGNIPTVGYGYVVNKNTAFYNSLTRTEARAMLAANINAAGYTTEVNKFIKNNSLRMSQCQFDALVSFSYNIGSGYWNGTGSCYVRDVLLNAAKPPENLSDSPRAAKTMTSGVVVFKEHDAESDSVTTLKKSAAVKVKNSWEDKLGNLWYQVTSSDGNGWVRAGDIRFDSYKGLTRDLDYADNYTFANHLLEWHRAGGQCLPGLYYRRLAEAKIFCYAEYDAADKSDWSNYTKNTYGWERPSCMFG